MAGYDSEIVLSPQPTAEAPFEQDDYPWGFRLRCRRRVWIETRSGYGMRPVTQTQDPRTGRWCKPKAGVYRPFCVAVLAGTPGEEDHVQFRDADLYHGSEKFEEFASRYGHVLAETRVAAARKALAREAAREAARKEEVQS